MNVLFSSGMKICFCSAVYTAVAKMSVAFHDIPTMLDSRNPKFYLCQCISPECVVISAGDNHSILKIKTAHT